MRRRHHYTIVLVIEHREDLDEPFTITRRILFQTNKRAIADVWYFNHLYLNTEIDPNDFGDNFYCIQTLRLEKDY